MIVFALALILAPEAAPEAPRPVATIRNSAGYDTKKICRTEVDIGTRLGGKRICRTQAEWDAYRAEQRKATERAQTQSSSCLRGGICSGDGP